MASAKNNHLISSQGPRFSPRSTAKTNDKSTNLWKNGTIGISDVVTASVYSEKTCMKKLMMMKMIIIIIIITRNVLLSAQMGERASVVLICIITSRYNEVK